MKKLEKTKTLCSQVVYTSVNTRPDIDSGSDMEQKTDQVS